MVKSIIKTGLFTVIASCAVNGYAASTSILGGVELDVTPLQEYVQKIKASCSGIEAKGLVAMIPAHCYKLPGNYIILLADPKDPKQRIATVSILYQKDFNNEVFTKYFKSLKKKYGEPVSSSIPFVGNKKVRWEQGDLVILIDEPHLDPNGQVVYFTKRMDALMKEQEQQKAQSERNSIDSML